MCLFAFVFFAFPFLLAVIVILTVAVCLFQGAGAGRVISDMHEAGRAGARLESIIAERRARFGARV